MYFYTIFFYFFHQLLSPISFLIRHSTVRPAPSAADADEVPTGHHLHPPRPNQRDPPVHRLPGPVSGRPLDREEHQDDVDCLPNHGPFF
jgi:hypothetical protein